MKQPWQMTREEWETAFEADRPSCCGSHRTTAAGRCNSASSHAGSERMKRVEWLKMGIPDALFHIGTEDEIRVPARHRDVIEHALELGFPVPPEVLKEYGMGVKACPGITA